MLCCVAGLLFGAAPSFGQTAEPLGAYVDTLSAQAAQPFVLRPYIIPGSERIWLDGRRLDEQAYRLDPRYGRLWIDTSIADSAQVIAHYQTWHASLRDVYRRRVPEPAAADSLPVAPSASAGVDAPGDTGGGAGAFGASTLQRSGSISRGIVAGNSRDVTVESGLRMELSGEITDGVAVQAVLTDANTPIQPEGTTQRLSDFDRVYIELDTRRARARLGDFDLDLDGGTFAPFGRRLQGVTVAGTVPAVGVVDSLGIVVAGATTRGIYRTQDIPLVDGVQGPYRLEGQANEPFIIVIAGTERVYLDGLLLTRGETNDYVIDYATGELRFTPAQLITADRRLTVEFQYTTNQFTRTLVGAETGVALWPGPAGRSRLRLGATWIREADTPSFSEELGFRPEDEALLAAAGDGPAQRSGAVVVPFDPDAPFVPYQREVTQDTVFVPIETAPPAGTPVYRVRFTRVGSGNGAYRREGRQLNGIVYTYVGAGRGDYLPVQRLPKPKRQQVVDLRGEVEPVRGLVAFGEWATSVNDENRLSELDAADDSGRAYRAGLEVRPFALGRTTLAGRVSRRVTGASFASFDRIRPIEFARAWNLNTTVVGAAGDLAQAIREVVDVAEATWQVSPQSRMSAEVGRLAFGKAFEGVRRAAAVQIDEERGPTVRYDGELITSTDDQAGERGRWHRHRGRLAYPVLSDRLTPRIDVEVEDRQQRTAGTDSLARGSFAFVEVRPGLEWTADDLTVSAEVERREEEAWLGGALRPAADAWTTRMRFTYRSSARFQSDASLGFRAQDVTEPFRDDQRLADSESVVLSWNGRWHPPGDIVRLNWFYEALTERTPTLQEVYYRSGPEFGEFVWEDDGDGIPEVDEFVPERTPNEGDYLRTFIPSDELTAVIGVEARLRGTLEAPRAWRQAGARWKRLLSGATSRTVIDVQEQSTEPDLAQIYLLNLSRFRNPETTRDGRLRISQQVRLLPASSRFGVDANLDRSLALRQLTAGLETRSRTFLSLDLRYRPRLRWTVSMQLAREANAVVSETFASRTYDIRSLSAEPQVAYTPAQGQQVSVSVAWAQKEDRRRGLSAQLWRVPVQGRFSAGSRLQLTGRAEVAHVRLAGAGADTGGLAAFELTQGRGAGTSLLWFVNGTYVLSRYLRASVQYDGRVPSEAPALHTVRMQLSAVF